MIQQTSLEAYQLVNIGARQTQVYLKLKEFRGATNAMLAKSLNLAINQITPRVYELRQKGLVVEATKGICPVTKHSAIFWKVLK